MADGAVICVLIKKRLRNFTLLIVKKSSADCEYILVAGFQGTVHSAHHWVTRPAVLQCYGKAENRVLKRVGAKQFFMKKILGVLVINLIFFCGALKSQVTVEAFPMDPQSGSHN